MAHRAVIPAATPTRARARTRESSRNADHWAPGLRVLVMGVVIGALAIGVLRTPFTSFEHRL